MRFAPSTALVAIGFAMLADVAPSRAGDTGPVIVVPSRPGIPIVINGRDASWSVVEGDIGLARPGHLTPVIIGGGRPLPPRGAYHRHHYFPSSGHAPARGRNETMPGADYVPPEPAESYHRSWSSSSDPQFYNPPQRTAQPQRPPDPQQGYVDEPRPRQQGYTAESDNLPPTLDDGQSPFAPPIIVVPRDYRGRR